MLLYLNKKLKSLIKPIIINKVIIRYMQKGGGKGVFDKLIEKCIGAGCNSTRPHMSPLAEKIRTPNTPVSNTNINTNVPDRNPTPVSNTPINNPPKQILPPFMKKDVESIRSNSPDITKSNPALLESSAKPQANVSNGVLKGEQPTVHETLQETSTSNLEVDSSDDSLISSVPVVKPTFLEELKTKVAIRNLEHPNYDVERNKSIIKKIEELEKRGLIVYQDNEEKTTKEFHELHRKMTQSKVKVDLDFHKITKFEVGLLQVTDTENTILLGGMHKHISVICLVHNDTKLVIGYLTSEKTAVNLSDNQPFNFEQQKESKGQQIALLHEPFIILNNIHIKPLNTIIKNDGVLVEQQKIGDDYINQPNIKQKIQQNLINQFSNQQEIFANVYTGVGITEEDITFIIKQQDILIEQKINKHLNTYMKMKNQFASNDKITQWLQNIKGSTNNQTYELLKQKIHEYENKNK